MPEQITEDGEVLTTAVAPAEPQPANIIKHEPAQTSLSALLTGPRGKLALALSKAVMSCQGVGKNATNTFQKYKYASADAIIDEARTHLAQNELALIPIESSLNGSERTGADRYELVRTFVLIHSSGESMPVRVAWPVCVEKGRPLDKATAIADTLSLSYLLRDLLMMPRVDAKDDVNARDDSRHEPERQPAPEQRQPPQDGPIGAATVDSIRKWLAHHGLSQQLFCDHYGIRSVEELPRSKQKDAAEKLKAGFPEWKLGQERTDIDPADADEAPTDAESIPF